MLHSLLHRLRMIRYYSAPRQETGLTRATDAALFVALVLAVPAALLSDLSVMRPGRALVVDGRLFETRMGRIVGAVERADRLETGWPEGELLGTFSVQLEEIRRGWPITTRLAVSSFIVDVDLHAEPAPRLDTTLEPDDPLRTAIERALRDEGEIEMLTAFRSGGDLPSHQRPLGWVAAGMLWLLMLCAVAVPLVRVVWLAWALSHGQRVARKSDRRAEGRCPQCGYDLRGLEYSERCPECGALTY